ncbi:alpha/beta hydrolase [Microbacterium sp. NPDC003461]|jgi:phospholipase/carboxylesterase
MPLIPALDDAAVLWRGDRDGRPLLVLLHGYGSDERDLFALARQLPDAFVVASVRAPMEPPWPTPGHAWYALEGEGARDPEAVTQAAARFLEWLDGTGHDGPVGLLGFSQGGAVALQALRLTPARFAFAVNLSGYVAPGALAGDATLAEARPPVFWGRGTADTVIPEALVVHTTDWLPAHTDLVGRIYPGLAHAVAEQELGDVRVFLEKQLTALADQD